jgi:hypothetical protein
MVIFYGHVNVYQRLTGMSLFQPCCLCISLSDLSGWPIRKSTKDAATTGRHVQIVAFTLFAEKVLATLTVCFAILRMVAAVISAELIESSPSDSHVLMPHCQIVIVHRIGNRTIVGH